MTGAAWLLAGLAIAPLQAVNAGTAGEGLSQCLAASASPDDKEQLVKWMFTAVTRHPALEQLPELPAGQVDALDRRVAATFTRLLTEDCLGQTRASLAQEGGDAIGTAFEALGQLAGQQVFGHPDVTAAIQNMSQHVDKEKFKQLVESPQPSVDGPGS
ncbi:hypothetical protein [Montanilutibacter psychrotolerans]|uniref:Uncharacterized protein n=1 Tax=Montanilutibacter psychrotolerans TaxID=1327343 RepID=A0A3M8SUP7_9GAMM|nr:hypothetical protein [Lysobacter psychrotolerans]RNF82580.1 hypothetical protein EER27_13825 [Lysobacter psychrotolerans]